MDLSRHYECFVCLGRLSEPLRCRRCEKSLCGSHVPSLKDRCPNCRTQPFQGCPDDTLNILLKCIKREEWEKLGKGAPYGCKIANCNFQGNYVGMIRHRRRTHCDKTIEEVMEGGPTDEENRAALLKIEKKLKAYRITLLTLSAVESTLQPRESDEMKKHPSHVFAREMSTHINNCKSTECQKMWNTRWGSYVGRQGEDIEGEFYLSECAEGKLLNQLLGWDYINPKY